MAISVVICNGDVEVFRVQSDGECNYTVTSPYLRHNARQVVAYNDDEVVGMLMRQLGAMMSEEFLRHSLKEHYGS